MGLDYVDIFYHHSPDLKTPSEEHDNFLFINQIIYHTEH